MFGWTKRKPETKPILRAPETLESLIARLPDLQDLLFGLGYDRVAQTAAASLMNDLRALARAEVADFGAFEKALAMAIARSDTLPESVSAFLKTLAAASGPEETLRVLNEDPIHDLVPWIEQLPVRKGGAITWKSPVRHTLIRKRPADREQFRNKLAELEKLFETPHPARSELARLGVLDAIAKLRREAERAECYLPTPFQLLETRLAAHGSAIKPGAGEWLRSLLATLERFVELRNRMEETGVGEPNALSEHAVRYLAAPRLQTPGLTGYILTLLLDSRVAVTVRAMSEPGTKMIEAIRSEISGGHFDGEETARRLRHLESEGFIAPSLVFPLLQLPARTPATGDRLITLAPRPGVAIHRAQKP